MSKTPTAMDILEIVKEFDVPAQRRGTLTVTKESIVGCVDRYIDQTLHAFGFTRSSFRAVDIAEQLRQQMIEKGFFVEAGKQTNVTT